MYVLCQTTTRVMERQRAMPICRKVLDTTVLVGSSYSYMHKT